MPRGTSIGDRLAHADGDGEREDVLAGGQVGASGQGRRDRGHAGLVACGALALAHEVAADEGQDDDARGDCPLSQLYRWAQTRNADLSIGTFHDALRLLHERQRIYLHPWTGPLYDLPEPHFALLVGHEVAYYASSRRTATVLMERVGC